MTHRQNLIEHIETMGFQLPDRTKEQLLHSADLKDESDRGMVLVGTSYIELWLERVLLKCMTLPNNELFKGANAPLASFSSKIDFSIAFGLIGVRLGKNLHIIRRIRNDIAHSYEPVDLSSSRMSNWIQSIAFLDFENMRTEMDSRMYFEFMVSMITGYLSSLHESVNPMEYVCLTGFDFDSDSEREDFHHVVLDIQSGKGKPPKSWAMPTQE